MKMTYVYNKPRLLPYYLPITTQPVIPEYKGIKSSSINFNGMFSRISNMKIGCSSCGK